MDNGESSYRRFLTGDDSGIVEIIREYKDGLTFFLNSFVGDINTAEELCEDTFVKLAVKKPGFHAKSSFKTFLYAIGRNVAIDYLKKSKKKIYLEDIGEVVSYEEDPVSLYIKEERKLAVHRAMGRLKSEYRQALWLTYFEELSNKETAAVMKKSVHSIETLIYRARLALKSQLEKEGFVYEEL